VAYSRLDMPAAILNVDDESVSSMFVNDGVTLTKRGRMHGEHDAPGNRTPDSLRRVSSVN